LESGQGKHFGVVGGILVFNQAFLDISGLEECIKAGLGSGRQADEEQTENASQDFFHGLLIMPRLFPTWQFFVWGFWLERKDVLRGALRRSSIGRRRN
jgi:hypothetical protein